MTEWQWQVILALCRLVLNSIKCYTYSMENKMKDINLLTEALNREIRKND